MWRASRRKLHLENVKMNDLNKNLLATVATQNGDFSDVLKELETAKANLAEAQDIIARANRFQNVMLETLELPIKDIVRDEINRTLEVSFEHLLEEHFDIHNYNDEIASMALEDFDINDHTSNLDMEPHSDDETKDLIRDILRGATFKMDV